MGALEGGYRGVEAGEVLLDFGDDAVLFGEGWEGEGDLLMCSLLRCVYVLYPLLQGGKHDFDIHMTG